MIFLKNSGKALLFSLISLLIFTLIITLGNYINLFSLKLVNILSYIIPFVSFFIGGFIIGKRSNNKGWLEGIKFGLISIFIFFIFIFIVLEQGFKISNIIFYLTIMFSSILGSMLGINKKGN